MTAYSGEVSRIATYCEGSRVSLPRAAGGVQLAAHLPAEDRKYLDRFEHALFVAPDVLLDRRQAEPIVPLCDPSLKHNRKQYVSFLSDLHARGML